MEPCQPTIILESSTYHILSMRVMGGPMRWSAMTLSKVSMSAICCTCTIWQCVNIFKIINHHFLAFNNNVWARAHWPHSLTVFFYLDTWIRPNITGSPSPACHHCSLTRVDNHRAVMFGGLGKDNELIPPDVYILDMLHWVSWSKEGHSKCMSVILPLQ